jgi:diapolycopene oxygenase
LAHHNFFYSKDQKSHFHRVFHEHRLPDDPTIYLVAPSVTDPTQAPVGCENIKILPHIPPIQEGDKAYTREDCVELKERVLDKLERMGLEGLRQNTVVEDFWTPFDIERRYYSNAGSIYGVVTDKKINYAFKAPKRSSKYRNLFFSGGSVNPGGGMPMVVLSGRHVAEMIQREA